MLPKLDACLWGMSPMCRRFAEGYLYLMRQTFVTGQTLVIDGGGLLV
jgi:hypothetical protein